MKLAWTLEKARPSNWPRKNTPGGRKRKSDKAARNVPGVKDGASNLHG